MISAIVANDPRPAPSARSRKGTRPLMLKRKSAARVNAITPVATGTPIT